tara:strand:- start:2633 stop:3562 length:930 start_codon:yes stop_codon:yes gene_type:complete
MEREIAVIKPKGVNHIKQAVTLTATYSLKGRSISLNQYGEVKPGNLTTNRGDIRFAGELATESKIFGDSVEEVEDQIDFWMNHPMVEDINGKGKDSSRFTIEVIAATKDKKRAKTVSVNRVVSTIYGMSEAERKDVMYFFKQDPRDMNDDDVTLELVDIEGGLLLREPNTSRFIETFGSLNKSSVAKKVEMLVYVNKGIVSGFVTEDADKFYIGDVLIGKDEDDIALFFKDNPQMYDNLVRSLADGGDDTAFNELNEAEDDDITPAEKRAHFTKLYKKYKFKGKFPADLDKAIERIHAYEEENGIELSE